MSEKEIARKIDTAWAINTKKDFCQVGKAVIPFDIICDLSNATSYSPNVNANSKNTLTVTHKIQGVVGNAGWGIESGVSQLAGEVILTNGSSTVIINGKSSVRDGDACLMNCSAAGKSNVPGKIYTSRVEAVAGRARESLKDVPGVETYWQTNEETARAVAGAIVGWKKTIATGWQAIGITGSPEEIAAARSSIGDGLQFMGDLLSSPSPEMDMAAAFNPAIQELTVEMRARQAAAAHQVVAGLQQTWNEAYERNGLVGAVTHMAVRFGMEAFVGPKGVGLAGKLAVKGIGMVSGKALAAIGRVMGGAGSITEKVALLEKEIAAAKAAGDSAEDIAVLTKARDELAAAAKAKGPGDGTLVRLSPPRPSVLKPGALEPHEKKFAEEILNQRSGEIVGAPKRGFPGIDGTIDGAPLSLKETEGGLGAVLKHASKAESQALNAGYSDVRLFIKAPNVTSASLLDFAGNGPLTLIPSNGTISEIVVRTGDGWVHIVGTKITRGY